MSLLDDTEKLGKTKPRKVNEPQDEGLVLALTFQDHEQELFYLKTKPALEAVERIYKLLASGLSKVIVLHNSKTDKWVGTLEQVKDFVGLIRIDDSIKTVRLIHPDDIRAIAD